MKSILQIYTLAMGPSSTLNTVPYLACRKVAHRIYMNGLIVDHVEIRLYNEYARLWKEAGIDRDIRNAFILGNFEYNINSTSPVPEECKDKPYTFDIIIYKTKTNVLRTHRVIATGGSSYYFTDERMGDKVPFYTYKDVKEWFAKHPKATYLDFAKLGNTEEDIVAKYHRGMAFAESAVTKGFIRESELQTDVKNIHYTRRALSIWKQDQSLLSEAEEVNRVVSAYSYAMSETLVEKQTYVAAPTLCTTPVVWSIMLALKLNRKISDKVLLEAWCAAYIFAALVDCGASLSETEVGCQGPMGTACGMAAVILSVVNYKANIEECGRVFEMALEHSLGLICSCMAGLPILPCIERCAQYATRAIDLSIMNHSLMASPELCKLDDVIKVLADTGSDLAIKNKRIGMSCYAKLFKDALNNISYKEKTKTTKKTKKGK